MAWGRGFSGCDGGVAYGGAYGGVGAGLRGAGPGERLGGGRFPGIELVKLGGGAFRGAGPPRDCGAGGLGWQAGKVILGHPRRRGGVMLCKGLGDASRIPQGGFLREKSPLQVALRPLSGSPTRGWRARTLIHSSNKRLLSCLPGGSVDG